MKENHNKGDSGETRPTGKGFEAHESKTLYKTQNIYSECLVKKALNAKHQEGGNSLVLSNLNCLTTSSE